MEAHQPVAPAPVETISPEEEWRSLRPSTAEFFADPRNGHSKELVAAELPVPQAAMAGQHGELSNAV